MWSKVSAYINKHKLLNANDLYIVALSGGADSVALLLLLKEGGFNVHAAHCNFLLRGSESDRDEAFCVDLCRQLGVELHRAHFATREYIGAVGICVAHHRDDSVETVLLNMIRGTGLRGLTGIQPRNGYVLRPLLCVSRDEIEHFLAKRGQKYVIDSTNLETDVKRNKVRLQVLPLLRTLNPAVSDNIQRMVENVAEAQIVLDSLLDNFKKHNTLELSELEKYGSSEYVIYEWLKNYGFNGTQARQVLEAETGKIMSSSQGYDVLKDRERLIIERTLKPFNPMRIPEEGMYVLDEKMRLSLRKCAAYVSKKPFVATFDAQKVVFPLTVRRVEEGDWMIPFGMRGRKLLSDLMTDRKMTVFEKRRQLVVVDAQDVIVWAVGLRIADSVAVAETTQSVLELILTF